MKRFIAKCDKRQIKKEIRVSTDIRLMELSRSEYILGTKNGYSVLQ